MCFLYLPKSFLSSIPYAIGLGDNTSPYIMRKLRNMVVNELF